ncbi:DNA methyltransferase [Spirulina sp. CCNP1310]|uniref:DNA methyltransferase n=1 Tax=Spirulina sp. CCNP1310 TaxID=3110249 RepID=UPI002B1F4AA3|nr:DNA methyltransferase [Spirulina sp. CCNP1310]MEA5420777.1 DNA methyltransferase [Spirulina sp. CCNP1310]
MTATPESLQKFVKFCEDRITGRERSEAQTFLDRFFRAFGHEGAMEAGAHYEEAIASGSKRGNTGFADLVWKPKVLIEMKSRGVDLKEHFAQAREYWFNLVPDRPRYVILCNFDEFWIYDFEQQVNEPMARVPLVELPNRLGAFTFMEYGQGLAPIFDNNQVAVTAKAGQRMGELFNALAERGERTQQFDRLTAQRFVLQCVMAMFAEDRGLLPPNLFISCVQDCQNGGSSYDIIGGLFNEMSRPGITPAGRYRGVNYFNGGLFATIHPIELEERELALLYASAQEDWSKVRPAIFGSIFENTADKVERHAHGMHFTSEGDIMKIVGPTINRFWEEQIEEANSLAELERIAIALSNYRVLDPACGSGNFLYMAYQEMKRIEFELGQKMREYGGELGEGLVSPLQFYGMDINPFGVELARVTLMIARKVAIDEWGMNEDALPLSQLDENIVCADALFTDWPAADAVIGNPPFLGGKNVRITLGDEYINRVFKQFPKIKDSVDFCSYWFQLAHDHITVDGRAGLVGTNSISQGKSRAASLEYIAANGGYIHNAISTQEWSGAASVHVSLVNWVKQKPAEYRLNQEIVKCINTSLTDLIDVTGAIRLNSNQNFSFQGIIPVGKGFYINPKLAQTWIDDDLKNREVLKLSVSASDLTDCINGYPKRMIIDFNDMLIEDARFYKAPFEYIKIHVKPKRDHNRRTITRKNWWKFGEKRPAMRKAIAPLSHYFAIPSHSKWFIGLPVEKDWIPNNSTTVVASDDFYILGILTSGIHRQWVKAQSSTLEDRTRYTPNTCFETFPFPQTAPPKLTEQIRQAAIALHEYRSDRMEKENCGITTLYNNYFHEPTSKLSKHHQKLDNLVMKAYGFTPNDDILEKLLTLNLELAAKEQRKEPIIGPWAGDRPPK